MAAAREKLYTCSILCMTCMTQLTMQRSSCMDMKASNAADKFLPMPLLPVVQPHPTANNERHSRTVRPYQSQQDAVQLQGNFQCDTLGHKRSGQRCHCITYLVNWHTGNSPSHNCHNCEWCRHFNLCHVQEWQL
jgi:hypothetical protein